MIGMILLAVLAVLIFFGLTDRFFAKMGVANWVAFLVVLAFAVAAVFPPLAIGSVTLSYAGFFLPVILAVVSMFAIGANGSLIRAIVAALAVAGVVLSTRVAFVPSGGYRNTLISVLIIGLSGGIVAYIIGQGRLAVFASLLGGIVLGDFISAMIFRFVLGESYLFQLGQNGIFDSIVLAVIVGGVTLEIANRIIVKVTGAADVPRLASKTAAQTEAAEDIRLDKPSSVIPIGDADDLIPPGEEDDLYDEYFNDDIDVK